LHEKGKVFPHVGRIDAVYGEKNLFCVCPPVSEFFTHEPGVGDDYDAKDHRK
jgi:hypothetical protein